MVGSGFYCIGRRVLSPFFYVTGLELIPVKPAILLVAFGTSADARPIYNQILEQVKEAFPGHVAEIVYSSDYMRQKAQESGDEKAALSVSERLRQFAQMPGFSAAVVQSLHVVSGSEFHKMRRDAAGSGVPHRVGLPLLCSPDDVEAVARILTALQPDVPASEAVLYLGHGTRHPSWAMYFALLHHIRELAGNRHFMAMIEHGRRTPAAMAAQIKAAGYTAVHMVPLTLIAGRHFRVDVSGDGPDSWKSVFEASGLSISFFPKRIGAFHGIGQIFVRHISDALQGLNNR